MNNEDSPETMFAVRVLGPLEVRSGSDVLEVGGPKPRLLLALLLTERRVGRLGRLTARRALG